MRALAVASLLLLGGCLRIQYDRCTEDPPHPDCADAGRDAATDAGTETDAGTDAGAEADGGSDAGAAIDSGTEDGGAELDAGLDAEVDGGADLPDAAPEDAGGG